MKATEQEMTVAVDAAARHTWTLLGSQLENTATFDELHPLEQNQLREQVLGPVVAALEVLPDRTEQARLQGICEVHAETISRLAQSGAAGVVQARLVHDRTCRACTSGELADCECDLAGTARTVLSALVVHVFGDYRTCRVCGCTEDDACTPPCYWIDADLCSACRPTDGQ